MRAFRMRTIKVPITCLSYSRGSCPHSAGVQLVANRAANHMRDMWVLQGSQLCRPGHSEMCQKAYRKGCCLRKGLYDVTHINLSNYPVAIPDRRTCFGSWRRNSCGWASAVGQRLGCIEGVGLQEIDLAHFDRVRSQVAGNVLHQLHDIVV